VGIAVKRIAHAFGFYRDTLGLSVVKQADLPEHGVRAALLSAGDSEIELLEPLRPDTGVARFLDKRGEGLHHVCFDTPEVGADLADLQQRGVSVLDANPRPGLAGQIAFLHPKACDGVLVELATPPREDEQRSTVSPLRLKRLVIGARDPAATKTKLQRLFGFSELVVNGGVRAMLGVGRSALLIVPQAEVGGTEGLVALSMVVDDFPALRGAFERRGVKALLGTGEVTVEPESSHGVHLHISRYE
jgi:methylmalonyl-CoA epimerase